MHGIRSQFVMSLLAGCCCLSLGQPVFASQTAKKHKAATPQAAIQPADPAPAPDPPPVPLTLQQMPAAPPQVSYKNGELTIVAQNSTLGDILRAVRDQTRADVEVPSNATERVVGHMGPGSAREVLAQLLDGSHFNYVILGSATDSTKVDRVILSIKPPSSEQNAVGAPVNVAPPASDDDSGINQPANQDDNENDASGAAGDQANQTPTPAPVRTPEQLLQELQRQQQQQQQQQAQPGQPQQQPTPQPTPPQRN